MNKTNSIFLLGNYRKTLKELLDKSVSSVTIPNSVTEIEGCVFWFCDTLTSVVLPEKLQIIGNWSFSGCTGCIC